MREKRFKKKEEVSEFGQDTPVELSEVPASPNDADDLIRRRLPLCFAVERLYKQDKFKV